MYNRFIFKIDVSRTASYNKAVYTGLSSCSHYPIIIDGVFIQISSVARGLPDAAAGSWRILYIYMYIHEHIHRYTGAIR